MKNSANFDESESTVRFLNFLLARGHDVNNDPGLELELRRLLLNDKMLWQCGYFNGGRLDWAQLLKSSPPGTFLVRYSSDPSCLYTLSFRNDCNSVNHMRIYLLNGWFTLFDDLRWGHHAGHVFESVLDLIEHYRHHPPRVLKTFMPDFDKPFYFKQPTLKHRCLRLIAGRMKKSPPTAISMLAIGSLGLTKQLEDEVKASAFPLEYLYERMVAERRRGL